MTAAIDEARDAGRLTGFNVRVVTGAGSYVAGEESALLRSIEGLRAEPSPKPPYPAERGLHGCPTVVQNVETLSVIPWLVASGRPSVTKAICLSGAVKRTGVVEVPFGLSLGEVLERAGGGPRGPAPWKMALVGGPMGRVVPAAAFAGTLLDYDRFPGMGHGGTVVLDETVSAAALARHLVPVRGLRVVRQLHAVPGGLWPAGRAARSGFARAPARHAGDGQPVRFRPGRPPADSPPARALSRGDVPMTPDPETPATVDGLPVAPAGSVLDTCRAAGVSLPAFCADGRVAAAGHCRGCLVEVDGRTVAACVTASRPGETVVTDSPRLRAYRQDSGELVAAEATPGGAVAATRVPRA